MYLTAHRILSAAGQTGINVFLHSCSPSIQPALETPNSIALVADGNPGKIIAHDCDVKPGGNRVLSFIDIVTPDPLQWEQLRTALTEASRDLLSASLPVSLVLNGIGIRFGANFGLYDELPKEYDSLVKRAMALLEQNPPGPSRR